MPADLLTSPDRWWQADLTITSHNTADLIAALPELLSATGRRWWFMRKPPGLRLRIETRPDDAESSHIALFQPLRATPHLADLTPTIYEAETTAFGGPAAMHQAHDLFVHDAAHIAINANCAGPLGQRELSILLITTMLRAAALEGYERGDVWARVTHDRPAGPNLPPETISRLAAQLRPLLSTPTGPGSAITAPGAPLAAHTPWLAAFDELGAGLTALHRTGNLGRGLRAVLAYHVIFHWNRLGLPLQHQTALAHAAQHAILADHTHAPVSTTR